MRYYDISIYNKDGQLIVPLPFKGFNTGSTYTNYIGGQIIAGGLDVEIQIRNYFYGNHQGSAKDGSFVTIYGVSLQEVSQSFNLTPKSPDDDYTITVKGGMQKGLPLAKPQQAGVLATGRIWQAIGNWEGINKSLTIMLYGAPLQLKNFQFIWRKGTPLSDAIATTLATAMPQYKQIIKISDQLIAIKDYQGSWGSFEAFATAVKNLSLNPQFGGFTTITGAPYAGVSITIRPRVNLSGAASGTAFPVPGGGTTSNVPVAGSDILVIDQTQQYQDNRTPTDPLQLDIEDFIGQPSWIEPVVVRFKTVMRADIRVGDFVKFPQKPFGSLFAIVTPDAAIRNAPSRNQLAFQSSYFIRRVTHYGRLRQADATSWVSVFEGVFVNLKLPATVPATPQGPLGGGGV